MDVIWSAKWGEAVRQRFGLMLRPQDVQKEEYKKEYEALRNAAGYLDGKDAEAAGKNSAH